MNTAASLHQMEGVAVTWKAAAGRAAWFTLLVICGLAVFVFGMDYHTRFWTNTSGGFKAGLSALFLVATVVLRRSKRGQAYWPVALAFFAASLTNVATWYLFEPIQRWLLGLFRVSVDSAPGLALGKLVDVVLRLAPILAVVRLAGGGLSTVYIRKGNLKWSLGLGLLALVNLLATALAVAASNGRDLAVVWASLPWWFAFSAMNGFMEEVWYRGLFLDRVRPVIGAAGAVWLTTLIFGASHLFATYVDPSGALVLGIITLTLGCAWALLMQKTRTLWGSAVFHMAADLYWLIAFGL